MAEPLIPYVSLPELSFGFLLHVPGLNLLLDPAHPPSIKPFGLLVVLGIAIGVIVTKRRAAQRKLDPGMMIDLIFWVVVPGFIGGHIFDGLFYHPERMPTAPLDILLYIPRIADGLSSYGGFIGAFIGALLWRAIKGHKILPHGDVINSALPIGWAFGRIGCATVHDHLGARSDAWYAVRVPDGPGYVGRYDLGLYECIFTIALATTFAVLWRRAPDRPIGFYSAWMCVTYAPVRFFLDFLRENAKDSPTGDARYSGLTPAQWACFGLLAIGIYLLRLVAKANAAKVASPQLARVPHPPT